MVKVDLGAGLSRIRVIHPAGADKCGEELELNAGSTDDAYMTSPVCGKPGVLIGVHNEAHAQEFLERIGDESVGRQGSIVLPSFDGKRTGAVQAPVEAQAR